MQFDIALHEQLVAVDKANSHTSYVTGKLCYSDKLKDCHLRSFNLVVLLLTLVCVFEQITGLTCT